MFQSTSIIHDYIHLEFLPPINWVLSWRNIEKIFEANTAHIQFTIITFIVVDLFN